MIKRDETKLNVFLHKSLWRILKIHWPMKVTNEEIRFKTNMEEITQQIQRRRWKMIGHVLTKSVNETTRISLTWTPEGRRRRGRPKETWRRTVERENEVNLGSKVGQKPVVVRRTEKLGERERMDLFPSQGKGQDNDDELHE